MLFVYESDNAHECLTEVFILNKQRKHSICQNWPGQTISVEMRISLLSKLSSQMSQFLNNMHGPADGSIERNS